MSIFIINRYWSLLDAFLPLLIWLCVCSFLACWCDGLHLLIFKCFVQNFYIYVHKRYCFVVFFFWNVLVWFWYEDNVGFIKWVGKYSLCFYLLKKVMENWYTMLNVCYNSLAIPSRPGNFCFWKVINYWLSFFSRCGLANSNCLILLWVLANCVLKETGPFHLHYQICGYGVVHNIPWFSI